MQMLNSSMLYNRFPNCRACGILEHSDGAKSRVDRHMVEVHSPGLPHRAHYSERELVMLVKVLIYLAALVASGPALFARPATDDLAGAWDSDFGWVTLETRKSGVVVGDWVQSPTKKGYISRGSFDIGTRILTVSIVQPWNGDKGSATFTLSADGSKLDGTWKHSSGAGKWSMTRVRGVNLDEQVDSILKNAGIKTNEPGMAVMVVQDGKIVVERCLGQANLAAGRPLTPTNAFELASVSKIITAQAVMIAHDRGLLNIADDVRKYVPELPVYDSSQPISIKHLLDHSSGLPNYLAFDYPKGADKRFVGLEDYAPAFAAQKTKFPARFVPGAQYEYSNVNYMLLALTVQRVAKKSFGTFLKDEVFKPLGMTTAFTYEHPDAVPVDPKLGYAGAVAYYADKGGYEPNRSMPPTGNEFVLTCGDGYLFASLLDLAKWDAGWRKGGLVRPDTLRLASVLMTTRDGKSASHGYVVDGQGRLKSLSKGGSNAGTRTSYTYDAGTSRTIITLCNRGDMDAAVADSLERLFAARHYKGK
jgi:CubicO group peptidase (beta-lactamase class C family)